MKKFLFILLVLSSVPAFAQHNFRHGHGHGYVHRGPSNWVWVAPTIIGGVIGYEIAKNQSSVVVQQPVIIQQPTVQQYQNCTPWTETQNPDGSIIRTRTCQQ